MEMDIDFMKDIAEGEKAGDEKKGPEDSPLLLFLLLLLLLL